jgi:hypothetical protein
MIYNLLIGTDLDLNTNLDIKIANNIKKAIFFIKTLGLPQTIIFSDNVKDHKFVCFLVKLFIKNNKLKFPEGFEFISTDPYTIELMNDLVRYSVMK